MHRLKFYCIVAMITRNSITFLFYRIYKYDKINVFIPSLSFYALNYIKSDAHASLVMQFIYRVKVFIYSIVYLKLIKKQSYLSIKTLNIRLFVQRPFHILVQINEAVY